MTISTEMYAAFADELVKTGAIIPLLRGAAGKLTGGTLGRLTRTGWGEMGGPIGKGLTLGFTGMAIPGAVSKDDPQGLGRSRAERISQLAGGTIGGLAGVGALAKPGAGWVSSMGRSLAGYLGGEIAGSQAATYPFRAARESRAHAALAREQAYIRHVEQQRRAAAAAARRRAVMPATGVAR